jgi:hypothetical protein
VRDRSAGTDAGERQLSTVSTSKAVIPLSAKIAHSASRPPSSFALLDAAIQTGWLPLSASQRQSGAVTQHELGATTMEITTVGLDLGMSFRFTSIGSAGGVVVRRSLRRAQVIRFFSKLPPCLIGMEACGTSHHWVLREA